LFSAFSLLVLAWFSVGYYHPDEHFQILEFARWKLDPSRPEPLPWEFHQQMRPAIQPALVVIVHKIFNLFGCSDPFLVTFFLRIMSASLTFVAMWLIYQRYKMEVSNKILRWWFLLLSFLLWFALYNAVRFSSETWSGAIFIIGFSYLFILKRTPGNIDFLITGILLGLSFLFRYQTGFLIAGYFMWFMVYGVILRINTALFPPDKPAEKLKKAHLLWMALGILGSVVAGVLIDRWFYGKWVLTAWNYFEQNLLADKISGFGIQPWWFYFEDITVRLIPPFSLLFIFCALIVFIFLRKNLLTWTLLPFILFHCFVGHKETRFLYPLIGFLPILVVKGIEVIIEKWNDKILVNKFVRFFIATFWVVNFSLLFIVFFIPADSQVNIYQKIYRQYQEPATLYYLSNNPFHRALDISYYKRSNLTIKQLHSTAGLDSIVEKHALLAIKSSDPDFGKLKTGRLIYSTFPEWMKILDINNWQARTQMWYVYEISK
jgi:phosphatidylinositol glycan class B